MNKTLAIAIAALFVAAALPATEARTESHSYIPGPYVTVVWCSAEEHSIVPHDWSQDEIIENPDGWANSGEPECAPHDAVNAAREAQGQPRTTGGYGGAAFTIQESEKGGVLSVTTDDDLFGLGASFVYLSAAAEDDANSQTVSGCGAQVVAIPLDAAPHWQNSPSNPLYLAWAYVDTVGVDSDLNVCFSSTGMAHGTFSN